MKAYNQKYFKVNRNLFARCWTENTRYGFRHLAELVYKNEKLEQTKACYYNRTWECFTYESVLRGLHNKAKENKSLTPRLLRLFDKFIKNGGRAEAKQIKSQMKTTAMVASLGAIFGNNQKESNDWKARMIKAGMPGLEMPKDWDTLSEDEKQTRLDKIIKEMKRE